MSREIEWWVALKKGHSIFLKKPLYIWRGMWYTIGVFVRETKNPIRRREWFFEKRVYDGCWFPYQRGITQCDMVKTAIARRVSLWGQWMNQRSRVGRFTISTRCGAGKLGTILLKSGKLGQYQSHRPLSEKWKIFSNPIYIWTEMWYNIGVLWDRKQVPQPKDGSLTIDDFWRLKERLVRHKANPLAASHPLEETRFREPWV